MSAEPTITVHVDPPVVQEATVTFSWSQDGENPFQLRNRWSISYDEVPLERLDRRILHDVFLSLQVPVWQLLGSPVVVHLPEPVPRVSLEFWTAYHGADRVQLIAPQDPSRHYDPRPSRLQRLVAARRGRVRGHEVAVTFGGGKDSTLAHEALLATRSADDVLLLHVVQHFSTRGPAKRETLERSLATILTSPVQRHGAPVQLVHTDFLAVLRAAGAAARPHVTLYTAALLPALVHRRVHQVVFSRTALGYRVDRLPSGQLRFSNPTGRPERLEMLRRYCADVLGWDLHAESTHRAVGEFVSFGTLLRAFPEAFSRMVMCTRTRAVQRFCQDCTKCLEFALMGLAHGHVAPDLDYDRLFTSPTVRRLVEGAERRRGQVAWHGSGPYDRATGTATHFATFCHTLHLLDPDDERIPAGPQARSHLRVLREVWGPVPFPAVARVDPRALSVAGPLGREVGAVAAQLHPCPDPGPDPDPRDREHLLLVGNDLAGRDDTQVMPTPELDAWARRWQIGPAPVTRT